MEHFGSEAEKKPKTDSRHVREVLTLAEQAAEGTIKVVPGAAWGRHFPVPAAERERTLQGVIEGKIKPEDAEKVLRPDALVYDVNDLDKEGLDAVSSKIFDESSTIKHYDYGRFTKFVASMKGAGLSVPECERLYENITKARTQKKLRDAFGTTGQRQMDEVLRRDAGLIVKRIGSLPRSEKVLQALKLDWLCEDRGVIGTEERDQSLAKLSGDERELFKKLSKQYRRYVDEGDEAGYDKLVQEVGKNFPKIAEKAKSSEKPSESMQELEKELENFKDTGMPGTPKDPGIPPEDSDEYHTPPPDTSGENKSSPEKQEQQPIFEITPPLGGYYASGRKSYYDVGSKTWSKKKQLSTYSGTLKPTQRHTLSGRTTSGIKSIPLPNSYTLDASSVKFTGAKPELCRDQNGCFYIKTSGPSTFSIEFGKEDSLFTGQTVAEDTAQLYAGGLGADSEALLVKLSGNAPHKAEQIRQHIWANHFYPGGGDLNAAQAVQAKLRHESSSAEYIRNIDSAEYIECYSANTLFVAMARKAGIPARLVVGHKVEGAHDGKAAITGSTGHAWSEIWDGKQWVRFDATPPAKPEDKKKDDKKEEEKKESAPDATDNGKDAAQPNQNPDADTGETSENKTPEASDKAVKEGEKKVEESKQQLEKAEKQKEELEKKLEDKESFKDLEQIKEEIEKSELLEDMKKELEEKAEAKEEQMKESIKEEMDKMVEDGFLDDEKRNELEKKLEEENAAALDRLQKQIEEENSLYNQYEEIKEEIMPLVDKWFEYFVERLPREQNVQLDEDSLTRQGQFSRRSVNRARNLLFGTIKNPRVIKSSVKPLFLGSILVDVSGSMNGTKLENARKLLIFYSELFSRIGEEFGYIRFSINTFSDSVNEIKSFEQEYDSRKRYSYPDGSSSTVKFRLMNTVKSKGGTNMLDSIKKAAHDLNNETHDFPDYASAFYLVGDGEDTCGNSDNVKDFLDINDKERGFGDHMRSAILLGSEREKQTLAKIFGDEHTTVAPDFDSLIEESMLRFNDDIEFYLQSKAA